MSETFFTIDSLSLRLIHFNTLKFQDEPSLRNSKKLALKIRYIPLWLVHFSLTFSSNISGKLLPFPLKILSYRMEVCTVRIN